MPEVATPPRAARVAVVLVNWHGAADTVACLRSLATIDPAGAELSAFVVDNASTDDSMAVIADALAERGFRPLAEDRAAPRVQSVVRWEAPPWAGALREVTLARTRENLGFAAGNNIGYRLAQAADPGLDFVWLLNNDTQLRSDCLAHLLAKMAAEPDVGMCGCTIVFFDDPNTIQCSGGVRYSTLTGRGWLIGAGLPLARGPDERTAEAVTDYLNGASMFLRCSQVDTIGLMAEDYFLYNEEIDWAWRARGRFRLGVATRAVVLHKEGATIGTGSARRRASPLANFYQTRSKLIFARRFTPWFLPTVWLMLLARFAKQYLQGDRRTSLIILQVLLGRRRPSPEWFRRRASGPAG